MARDHLHAVEYSRAAARSEGVRSALAAPASLRLAIVGAIAIVLWGAVWWALAS